jgi:hypothetical protein
MKTTSLALAALLLAGAVSAPALALANDDSAFDNDWYDTQLQHKGVNAIAAYEGAPGEIRAVVQTADGQVFQYFDDETLAPIGTNAVATQPRTRVLSKLDVGAPKAPTFSQYSLLAPDTDHDN